MHSALRYLLLGAGWLSLGAGMLGLVVPVLPTVPFVLLAAACFMRSSERLYRWVLSHPRFGDECQAYLDGRGLARRTKMIALATLWGSILTSTVLLRPTTWPAVALVAVAAGVTLYIVRLPARSA